MNPTKIIFSAVLAFLVVSLIIIIIGMGAGARDAGNAATTTDDEAEEVILPDNLRNLNIEAGARIESPVTLTGEARLWYFEASFPITIEDNQGNFLAQAPAQAQGEWMTEEFVPFEATLTFSTEEEMPGYIVYSKDNPSGLPENDESFRLPVILAPNQENGSRDMVVEVYFSPSEIGNDCSVVVVEERTIARTDAPATAALEELIRGPREHEFNYSTSIPRDLEINSLTIEDGVAEVDFSEELNEIAGSCAVTAARAQIESTLKQFSTVSEVVISVDGNVDEALQP